jgi:hypothetical protein
VVIEDVRQVSVAPINPSAEEKAFLASLAVSHLPAGNLFVLYDGILGHLAALEASRITGAFAPPEFGEGATALQESLDRHGKLLREIDLLRAKAVKERQLNRRVELNVEIQRLQAELAAIQTEL